MIGQVKFWVWMWLVGFCVQFQYGEDGLDILRTPFLTPRQFPFLVSNSQALTNKQAVRDIRKRLGERWTAQDIKHQVRERGGGNEMFGCTVEPVLKDHPIGHKNVVFQDRWSLVTDSVTCTLKFWTFWPFKTCGLSWQWSLKTGSTVHIFAIGQALREQWGERRKWPRSDSNSRTFDLKPNILPVSQRTKRKWEGLIYRIWSCCAEVSLIVIQSSYYPKYRYM